MIAPIAGLIAIVAILILLAFAAGRHAATFRRAPARIPHPDDAKLHVDLVHLSADQKDVLAAILENRLVNLESHWLQLHAMTLSTFNLLCANEEGRVALTPRGRVLALEAKAEREEACR